MPALHNVQVSDNQCDVVNYVSGDVDGDNILDVSETWTYTCKTDLDSTTLNTVTAVGSANNQTATDVAFATVSVAPRPSVIVAPELPVAPVFHPASPVAPTPEVPYLPNTGVGPVTTEGMMPWTILVSGLLITLSVLFVACEAQFLFSSSKNE